MKNYFLPYFQKTKKMQCALLCIAILSGINSYLHANSDWNVLSYEEFVTTYGEEEPYFKYWESTFLGLEKEVSEKKALVMMEPDEPECPEIFYDISYDLGPLVTNGIVYESMIDKKMGKPFCLIDETDCFNLDGLNLHGRPKSDVFFDIYNYQVNPETDPCYFNFFFTEYTNTKHVKAFLFRSELNADSTYSIACFGDTETMTSIPVRCEEGENRLPTFWTIVVAGLKWEKYAFKIKPDGPCSDVDVIELELGFDGLGNSSIFLEGNLKAQGNNFENCARLSALNSENVVVSGDEKGHIPPSDKAPQCIYDKCYPSSGCSLFQGDDIVYSFNLEGGINEVTITLDNKGSGEVLGMFLYSYLCGGDCLDFAEIKCSDGSATIFNDFLASGKYFLVIDSDDPRGIGKFDLSINTFTAGGAIFEVRLDDPTNNCPQPSAQNIPPPPHDLQVYLLGNTVIEGRTLNEYANDNQPVQLYFMYPFDGNQADFRLNSNLEVQIADPLPRPLLADINNNSLPPVDPTKCGYQNIDSIQVRAFVGPAGGESANIAKPVKPTYFRKPRGVKFQGTQQDYLVNIEDDPEGVVTIADNISFFGTAQTNFKFIAPEGDTRSVLVQSDGAWSIDELTIPEWIIIENEFLNGFGYTNIEVTLLRNTIVEGENEVDSEIPRSDTINILSLGGLAQQIIFNQLGFCSFLPCINVNSIEINCDRPSAKLSVEGCASKAGILTEWFINNEPFEGRADINPDLQIGNNEIRLVITDQVSGCVNELEEFIFIPEGGGPQIWLNTMEVMTCKFEKKGMFTLKPKKGTPPYSILWSTGDTTMILNEVNPGWYGVTITDANGCQATKSIDFDVHGQPFMGGKIGSDQILCADKNDPSTIINLELPMDDNNPNNWNFSWRKSTNLCNDNQAPGGGDWEIRSNENSAVQTGVVEYR